MPRLWKAEAGALIAKAGLLRTGQQNPSWNEVVVRPWPGRFGASRRRKVRIIFGGESPGRTHDTIVQMLNPDRLVDPLS